MESADKPAYLPKISAAGYWSRIEMMFGSLSILFDMEFETEQQAVGEKVRTKTGKREWLSNEPRWDGVRSWLLLPYIHALDERRLREQFEIGRTLAPKIREHIVKRELSLEFLDEWGRFRAASGLLEFLYESKTSIGHQRSAYAGGEAKREISEEHQRWFAYYFLRKYKRGQRPEAEAAVVAFINAIVEGGIDAGSHHDVKWFEQFLHLDDAHSANYLTLREAYKENHLSVKLMKELVARGPEGIPPVDLEFPDP